MGRHAQNAREAIVDAAEDVVIKVGARHLTLEAVAKQAGVSKGGVLYHFPSKEALLHAMLDRRFLRTEEKRQVRRADVPGGPGSELAAYVLSSLEQDDRKQKLGVSLLAAAAHDPRLLLPYRDEYRRRLEEFSNDGPSLKRAAVVMLAIDGLRSMELLSLAPFSGKERNGIVEELIALSRDEDARKKE
jgi:AcrR family transcriptional regulator